MTIDAEPPSDPEPATDRGSLAPHQGPARGGLSEGIKGLIAAVVVVLAIAAGIALYVTHEHPGLRCVTRAASTPLVTTTTRLDGPTTTLPPSHDNDAGRSRIPDSTPDADNDASRSLLICP